MLGWLLNQRLVATVDEVEAIMVDWDVGAAAVKTRAGISHIEERTARRTVTTGCGQGTVFGDAMAEVGRLVLPDGRAHRPRRTLLTMLDRMRHRASVHRAAGSVHGCGLFKGGEMLVACEDVGRHNAIDTIAGWMATRGRHRRRQALLHHRPAHQRDGDEGRADGHRTGRQPQRRDAAMGHELAERLHMTLIGRAANRASCVTAARNASPRCPPPWANPPDRGVCDNLSQRLSASTGQSPLYRRTRQEITPACAA